MLGTASRRKLSFQIWLKSTLNKSQRKLKAELLKNCPRNLLEQSHLFWVLCPSLTSFFEPASRDMLWNCFGNIPEQWFRKLENREHTGDRSQNAPYHKVELSIRRTSNLIDSEQEETLHSLSHWAHIFSQQWDRILQSRVQAELSWLIWILQ